MNNKQKQKGAALLLVLWATLLLSAILAGALVAARGEAAAARFRLEQTRARAAALSGLDVAMARLTLEGNGALEGLYSEPLILNDLTVTLSWGPQYRQLDINLAAESELAAFLSQNGLEVDEANALAARIADWRDTDDLVRPNGAERRDYGRADTNQSIGNRPFENVSELSRVLNFPSELLSCLASKLTVVGVSRERRDLRDKTDVKNRGLAASSGGRQFGQRYAVSAIAKSDNGLVYRLTSLFRVTRNEVQPFEVIFLLHDAEHSFHYDSQCTQ